MEKEYCIKIYRVMCYCDNTGFDSLWLSHSFRQLFKHKYLAYISKSKTFQTKLQSYKHCIVT